MTESSSDTEKDIETCTALEVAMKYTPIGWKDEFMNSQKELEVVSGLLEKDEANKKMKFVPLRADLFAAFHAVPLNNVNVVIIGQDPYQTPNWAIGRSFSVKKGCQIPPSLLNIFKEIRDSIPGFKMPKHGNLSNWEIQGVLLLNISLTTRPNESNAHSAYMIWTPFVKKMLEALAQKRPNCIYLLWGKESQKIRKYLGDKSIVLEAAHPSPMSANRGGWFGCGHFVKVNQILQSQGKPSIDWNVE